MKIICKLKYIDCGEGGEIIRELEGLVKGLKIGYISNILCGF